jgi:hypothetical protein
LRGNKADLFSTLSAPVAGTKSIRFPSGRLRRPSTLAADAALGRVLRVFFDSALLSETSFSGAFSPRARLNRSDKPPLRADFAA